MTAREFLVRIRMVFLKEGESDAAKSVDGLAQSVDKVEKQVTGAWGKAKGWMSAQMERLGKEAGKTSEMLGTLRGAMMGNAAAAVKLQEQLSKLAENSESAIGRLAGSMKGLGSSIKALGPVLAAFWVGWSVGDAIYKKWVEPLVGKMGDLRNHLRKTREELDRVNAAKLDQIMKEVQKIDEAFKKATASINNAAERLALLRDAQEAVEIAKIKQTMPEGDARDKAIADVESRYAAKRSSDQVATSQRMVDEESAARAARQKEKEKLDADMADARKKAETYRDVVNTMRGSRGSMTDKEWNDLEMKAAAARKDADSKQVEYDAKLKELQARDETSRQAIELEKARIAAEQAKQAAESGGSTEQVGKDVSAAVRSAEIDRSGKTIVDVVLEAFKKKSDQEAEDVRKAELLLKNPGQPSVAEAEMIAIQKRQAEDAARNLQLFITASRENNTVLVNALTTMKGDITNLTEVMKRLPQ